jgi:hypothetical protein
MAARRPRQREPRQAGRGHQHEVGDEPDPPGDPVAVLDQGVAEQSQEASDRGRHKAQQQAGADRPPAAALEQAEARACGDGGGGQLVPQDVGTGDRQGLAPLIGREQGDDQRHRAQDRQWAGDPEQAVACRSR